MRNIVIGAVVLVLLASGMGFLWMERGQAQAEAEATAVPTAALEATASAPRVLPPGVLVVTNGVVRPETSETVRFAIPGLISEVLVEEGQLVHVGDVLAKIDTRALEVGVEDAQLKLEQVKLDLEQLKVTPMEEEVRLNQTRVDLARAELRQVQAQVNQQDVVAAQESTNASQQNIAEIAAGPRSEELQIAQANVAAAQAQLKKVRDETSANKTKLELNLQQTANDLRNRQDEYSRIHWRNVTNAKDRALEQQEIDEEAKALRAVQDAEASVERARVEYAEAQQAEASSIAQAEANVKDAQSRLDLLLAGPQESERAAARAAAATNAAQLERVGGEERAASLESARARVAEAEAALALLKAKPTDANMAQANLAVKRAELDLKHAQLALEQANIRAPMDGTITMIGMRPGDSTTDASLEIADLSAWRVETDFLSEIDVVRIREGSKAILNFVSLPDLELTGRVEKLVLATQPSGQRAFRAVIVPDSWDDRLRQYLSVSVKVVSE